MAAKDDAKNRLELLNIIQDINRNLQEELNKSNAILSVQERRKILSEILKNDQEIKNQYLEIEKEHREGALKLTKQQEAQLNEIEESQSNINTGVSTEIGRRERMNKILATTNSLFQSGWKILMDYDTTIKSTVLNLGLSGAKADYMRNSFENSAQYVARLGGNIEDIGNIMEGYADETGRARALTADMVKDITAIGYGTGIGVETATRLGAQFELMGYDAKTTMEYVQGVVDTSERMGVNTTKVLKNISANFKELNKYHFKQGVAGYAQMAQYAEKMKIDMGQALNSVETAKSLEGAIGLAAQLQVMGGEFAKTDPFELLFLSRNDPAKFTEKINEMTKGVVTFRKMSDGSFEKFISPADRDRLAAVEKSLGMQSGELTTQALRMADIQKMRGTMQGLGLSKEQKEIVEGAAVFNKETGKFQVQVAGHMKNISQLTSDQAEAFAMEQKSLEDRAKEAQTFDKAFQATINEFKSMLMPLLQDVNSVLKFIRPYVETFTEWVSKLVKESPNMLKTAGIFLLAAKAFSVGRSAMGGVKGIASKRSGGITSLLGGGKGSTAGKVGGTAAKGGGLGTGAGIGLAAVGTGAGIMLAAEGISKLADSMSKLDKDQVEALETIAMTLAITFPLAAVGILLAGGAATASAPGLLALGAAVLMIGGAVGIAAWGIGQMAEGLGSLIEKGKGAGDDMFTLSAGIGALSLALLGFAGSTIGMLAFAGVMATIAATSDSIAKAGAGFKEINAVMSGNKEDYIAVANAIQSISNSNISGGGMFTELATLLKTPLKVEFANADVNLNNNITLEIDGQKFMAKTYNSKMAIEKEENTRIGKGNQ